MKYFIDFEFLDAGRAVLWPISIGIVANDGTSYYAVFQDAKKIQTFISRQADWLRDNVFPHIDWTIAKPLEQIKEELLAFIKLDTPPQFWGYYCDYDWVIFCSLFGPMVDLPKGFPMYCLDLKQLAVMAGNPRLPHKPQIEHHAEFDAHAMMHNYFWLKGNFPELFQHLD